MITLESLKKAGKVSDEKIIRKKYSAEQTQNAVYSAIKEHEPVLQKTLKEKMPLPISVATINLAIVMLHKKGLIDISKNPKTKEHTLKTIDNY